MKTAFVLAHVPNPRINKRIAVAKELGDTYVVCVRRVQADVWEPKFSDVPHHIHQADFPTSHQPFRRLFASFQFARHVLKILRKDKPDLIYTGTLDNLAIARLFQLFNRKTKIVLEIADVRENFLSEKKNTRTRLISMAEKKLYRHVEYLVLTSELFYDKHYNRYFPKDKAIIMHNIPDFRVFDSYRKKTDGSYTVGFIGGIRYVEQMKMLVDAAQKTGVKLLFAGAAFSPQDQQQINDYCRGNKQVTFTGRYRYDQDIARLYGSVDCVYAVYDADNPNVRIALPNKLYEAAYCGLPIIVARGTYLSELVERYQLGYSVSHEDVEDLIHMLQKLKAESPQVAQSRSNTGKAFLASLPDASRLAEALRSLQT